MSSLSIANRYARALYSVVEPSKLDETIETLSGVSHLFDLDDASKVLNSPVMPADLKSELLNYALGQLNSSRTVSVFFEVVLASKRVSLIPQIVQCFKAAVDESRGVCKAQLVSAHSLEAEQIEEIRRFSEKSFGVNLEVEAKLDKALLGGFIVNVGNKRIDLSLKSKLEALTATAAQ